MFSYQLLDCESRLIHESCWLCQNNLFAINADVRAKGQFLASFKLSPMLDSKLVQNFKANVVPGILVFLSRVP